MLFRSGAISEPILWKGHYWLVKLTNKRGLIKVKFEEVKTSVEFDYKLLKSQEKYKELVSNAISGDEVEMFPENIK